jgi:hypothetical protein
MSASIQNHYDLPLSLSDISTELEAELLFYELLDRIDEEPLNRLLWTKALNLFEHWGQETWVAPLRARRARLAKLKAHVQEEVTLLATASDAAVLHSKAAYFVELAPVVVGGEVCVLRFDDGTQAIYLGDVWTCTLCAD